LQFSAASNAADPSPLRLSDIAVLPRRALERTHAFLGDITTPTVRLGVTGLARSGKTVFITALVRNLTTGGRLPFLSAYAEGRAREAYLEPQPDDAVPRFDYEGNVAAITQSEPEWPASTRQISQLRLTIVYQSSSPLARAFGPRKLHLDVVDYPGEWLLDLAMLKQTYPQWSSEAIALARHPARRTAASAWLAFLGTLDPSAAQDEQTALAGARLYTEYLRNARLAEPALSTVGPGRFLMPGDLEGSPLLTFFPLQIASAPKRGSLAAMMERRFESYKSHVVAPFFRDHFSRLDRQIVLIDALAALNLGADALDDLMRGLDQSLMAFRPGARRWLAGLIWPRIDRLLFAATKADHLPQSSHDRLEAILRLLIDKAAGRAVAAGADIKVMALAALRATRETEAQQGTERLACIRGVPERGERLGSTVFDGRSEVAIFPGDLPEDPQQALSRASQSPAGGESVRFVRFRPPRLSPTASTIEPAPWPHVRLDRALEFLIGDLLR
jgi:predicted YcjX-like family ATPase